jgi:uroporphyrinogen III methyltransferase/synthase
MAFPLTTPIALIRWGTRPRTGSVDSDRRHDCRVAAEHKFQPPAIAVVGEVATTRTFTLVRHEAVVRQRIVVTRPREQAQRFVDLLEQQGAEVVRSYDRNCSAGFLQTVGRRAR